MSSARLITTTLGPSEPSFWLHPRACLTSATAQRQQSQMLNVSSNGWGPQPWQIAPDPFANSNTTNQIKTICRIWTNSNHINIWNHPKHTQPPSCRRFIFASFSPVAPSTSIAWVADARPPSSCWARVDLHEDFLRGQGLTCETLEIGGTWRFSVGENAVVSVFWVKMWSRTTNCIINVSWVSIGG